MSLQEENLRELAVDLDKHGMPACAVFVLRGADKIAELEKALRDVVALWEERDGNFECTDDSLPYAMVCRARGALPKTEPKAEAAE